MWCATGILCISGLMFRPYKFILIISAGLLFGQALLVAQENNLKSVQAAGQYLSTRGEVILKFSKPGDITIGEITAFLSVDDFRNDTIIAYANEAAFKHFLELDIPFQVIQPPSLRKSFAEPGIKSLMDWHNRYPDYQQYLNLMTSFNTSYPEISRLVDFGTTVKGHKLLALKITDNPDVNEKEPVLLYAAAIHGDEPLGYVLMLRLSEYLLTNYNSDPLVRNLVDHLEIWINPLSNPDGTYFESDTTIAGATRFNSHQVDLNRNFPDVRFVVSDSVQRQPETLSMIHFMELIRPVLSANFHGGAEVVNYPWDTWNRRHADDAWFQYISRAYADTAHAHAPAGYMTYLRNGITNGNDWYPVYGGRQDYVNYFLSGREVTIELSNDKIPAESSLDNYWNYNRQSLLQYMNEALTGFTGEITDSLSGSPLVAQIGIMNHDEDNSFVYSRSDDGIYFRLIGEGQYPLKISAPGYKSKFTDVSVNNGILTPMNIQLTPDLNGNIFPNPFTDVFHLYVAEPGYYLNLVFIDLLGREVKFVHQPVTNSGVQDISTEDLSPGYYIVQITYQDKARTSADR